MGRRLTADEEGLAKLCGLNPDKRIYEVVEATSFFDVYRDVQVRRLKPYFMELTHFIETPTRRSEAHLRLLKADQDDAAEYVACMLSERTRKDEHTIGWERIYKLFVPIDCTTKNGTPMAWPKLKPVPSMDDYDISDWTVLPEGKYEVVHVGRSFQNAWEIAYRTGYKPGDFRKFETKNQQGGSSGKPQPVKNLEPPHQHAYLTLVDRGTSMARGMITSEGMDLPHYRVYLRM